MTGGEKPGLAKEVLSLPKLLEVSLDSHLVWDS